MTLGLNADTGCNTITLSSEETKQFKSRKPVCKTVETSEGVFRIEVKMTKLRKKCL